ncbi:MAG: hypothetical protein BAA04_12135 [Firmicutes bacterium ZCTH02-B6]|nr:MAG: hypothetical protein BAA04_12135 [Firmicutes bacterium ZCTH02-B6]
MANGGSHPRREASELVQHWPILAVAFCVSLISTGLRFAIGPFMRPLVEEFGFTHSQLSGIVAATMLIFGLALPVVGRLADRWGSRTVVAAGTVLMAGSLALVALSRSPAVFAAGFAGVASLALAATGQVALSPVISHWFRRQRGFAMMFLSAGGMGGTALLTPVSTALIAAVGWRATYLLFAGFSLVVLLPLVLRWVRDEPLPIPLAKTPAWQPALATKPFWLLACGMFACGFSMHLMGTHGVPMLEHHGFPPLTASFGVGLIGLVSIWSTLGLGVLADRIGKPVFLGLIYLVRGLGFLALVAVGQEWELYLTATIGGLAWAGSTALTSAITADIYGARIVGILFGLLYLGHQIGAAAGSYLGGWAFDTLGDYSVAFVAAAGLLFVAAAASWRIGAHQPGASAGIQAQPAA